MNLYTQTVKVQSNGVFFLGGGGQRSEFNSCLMSVCVCVLIALTDFPLDIIISWLSCNELFNLSQLRLIKQIKVRRWEEVSSHLFLVSSLHLTWFKSASRWSTVVFTMRRCQLVTLLFVYVGLREPHGSEGVNASSSSLAPCFTEGSVSCISLSLSCYHWAHDSDTSCCTQCTTE